MTDIMRKVAEVAPRHYAFLLKTASEVKSSPFKDEIVENLDSLIKQAINWGAVGGAAKSGLGAMGRGAAHVGGAVGTAALGGIALALAGDMYDAAKRGLTKTRNYQNMLQANPDLKQLPAKNVQNAFSVLHKFNPDFASDPTVAGAWVKRQATFGEDALADTNQLKQLVDARKNIVDSRKLMGVPEVKGMRGNAGGFGHKERKQLSDLNQGVVDLDDRVGRFENQ
jgi:hypothetical protein